MITRFCLGLIQVLKNGWDKTFTFDEALRICKQNGGEMPVPKNDSDNERFFYLASTMLAHTKANSEEIQEMGKES